MFNLVCVFVYPVHFFTLYTHRYTPVCFDVLCESGSNKNMYELTETPFTFKIPEGYRMCQIVRLFLNLYYYKDICIGICEINTTKTMLQLDLCSLVKKRCCHSPEACWAPETAQMLGRPSKALATLRSRLWPP